MSNEGTHYVEIERTDGTLTVRDITRLSKLLGFGRGSKHGANSYCMWQGYASEEAAERVGSNCLRSLQGEPFEVREVFKPGG